MSNEWYDIDSWQWVDNDSAQWGFLDVFVYGVGLNQIWTDNKYVYAATTSGLDIINIETEQRQSFITNSSGYSSVWSDNEKIFIGSTAGIKFFNQATIGPPEMIYFIADYVRIPDITSNNIKYIHGNSNKLICCTVEGIDIIRRDTGYITHTIISGATKCFVTPEYDYYYYTISGTTNWSLNRLDGNTGDWDLPDMIYTTGSGFLAGSTRINDFYVTEHTSVGGVYNTLFIATDLGVYVYDEGSTEHRCFMTLL